MLETLNPARCGATGLIGRNSSLATDNFSISPKAAPAQVQNPAAVAAAIADLTIECAVEAAHVSSVASRHFVENVELGDLWASEHSLGVAVAHLREAAKTFREWQALTRWP